MDKYIVKENNHYIQFDRIVDGFEVTTIYEPVAAVAIASEFSSEESARKMIDIIDEQGYDVSNFCVINKEAEIKRLEEEALQRTKEAYKEAWKNTSDERKEEIIKAILDKDGTKGVKEWLDRVDDPNYLTASSASTSTSSTASCSCGGSCSCSSCSCSTDDDEDEDDDWMDAAKVIKKTEAFLKKHPEVNPDTSYVVFGWNAFGDEQFIKNIDIEALKSAYAKGYIPWDDVESYIELTDEYHECVINAKFFTEEEAEEIYNILENCINPMEYDGQPRTDFHLAENDNDYMSISKYIETLKEEAPDL